MVRTCIAAIALAGSIGCGNCGHTDGLVVTQFLSAAVLDEIYAIRDNDGPRCALACDYGVQQEEGADHRVLSLTECQFDPDPDFEPQEPGQDPTRTQVEGGRVKCSGTAWVTHPQCSDQETL